MSIGSKVLAFSPIHLDRGLILPEIIAQWQDLPIKDFDVSRQFALTQHHRHKNKKFEVLVYLEIRQMLIAF